MATVSTYTILMPEERLVGITDRGTVVRVTKHLFEDADEAEVMERQGCEYYPTLVFGTEKDLRNVLFWCMNSAPDDDLYGFYFKDPSLRCRSLVVRDTGTEMGNGLFTTEAISCSGDGSSSGSNSRPVVIGEYTGLLVDTMDTGAYSMAYYVSSSHGFEQNWQIDAKEVGNLMRFVNHSSTANVKFQNVFYGHMWHVLLVVIRDIEKDEQLFANYGPLYWVGKKENVLTDLLDGFKCHDWDNKV